MTRVPLPVTILNPRLASCSSTTSPWLRRPEMTSASLGSATRHIILNSTITAITARRIKPPVTYGTASMYSTSRWFLRGG
jgi:hypothetical protein